MSPDFWIEINYTYGVHTLKPWIGSIESAHEHCARLAQDAHTNVVILLAGEYDPTQGIPLSSHVLADFQKYPMKGARVWTQNK